MVDRCVELLDLVIKHKGRIQAFLLTYLLYAGYHTTRKVYGLVKSSLHPKEVTDENPGWSPFESNTLLGTLDTVFLSCYAAGLVVVGGLALKYGPKTLLFFGGIGASIFCALFGVAYYAGIHSVVWFIFTNGMAGVMQATGWPCVIAIMGNWFGAGKRGLVFGLWQSNTAIGNILGNAIGSWGLTTSMHGHNWALAAILPAIFLFIVTLIVCALLKPAPVTPMSGQSENTSGYGSASDTTNLLTGDSSSSNSEAIDLDYQHSSSAPTTITTVVVASSSPSSSDGTASNNGSGESNNKNNGVSEADAAALSKLAEKPGLRFWQAIQMEGVVPFAMCLFCSKLVAYSMLFWLPHYLSQNGYTDAEANEISSFFDVGGILGGVVVGYLKDRTGRPASVITTFLLISIPTLLLFRQVTASDGSLTASSFLMIAMGLFVDGPMHMIAGAICADLGSDTLVALRAEEAAERQKLGLPPRTEEEDEASFTAAHGGQKMRTREAESIALVTGIVDGLASVGGATQGVAVGLALDYGGWDAVFWLFIGTSFAAALFLSRLLLKECGCRQRSHVPLTQAH